MARRTSKLTHVTPDGQVRMVDVGDKAVSERRAVAAGRVQVSEKAMDEV